MSKSCFVLFLSILWLLEFFAPQVPFVKATITQRVVGVKPGDWFELQNTLTWSSTDPDATLPQNMVLLSEAKTITFQVVTVVDQQVVWHRSKVTFKNGTETDWGSIVQFNASSGWRSEYAWFICACLYAGDIIYSSPPYDPWIGATINETISETFKGIEREINIFNVTSQIQNKGNNSIVQMVCYWDRFSGVLCRRSYFWSITNSTGIYSMLWLQELTGTNLWGGGDFLVETDSANFTVALRSNSSISYFSCNISLHQILFDVTGFLGTTGYCNISIPDDLFWGDFALFKNGSPLIRDKDYTQTYNGTHYIFYITYCHDTYTIEIRSTEAISEFSSFILIPLFMIATLLAITIYKKKRSDSSLEMLSPADFMQGLSCLKEKIFGFL